jgi:hypothetical protein
MRKIVIEVKPNGDITMEAQGIKGSLCLKNTSWLEKALGGKVRSRVFKKDYHENELILRKEG